MLAEVRHFDDAQCHAAHLPGWQQVYDQISGGRFYSSLSRLNTGHLEVFREAFNQRVVQYGRAQPAWCTLPFPSTPAATDPAGARGGHACHYRLAQQ
jgi:hypothetical protein